MSAAKSSAARRQACQAWRAARRPSSFSAAAKLTPGSSEIHPLEKRAHAAADLPRFDQRHLDAGGGEGIRRRAAGQPAADDDDVEFDDCL